jgi:hypothetical protein
MIEPPRAGRFIRLPLPAVAVPDASRICPELVEEGRLIPESLKSNYPLYETVFIEAHVYGPP